MHQNRKWIYPYKALYFPKSHWFFLIPTRLRGNAVETRRVSQRGAKAFPRGASLPTVKEKPQRGKMFVD
jgi:hypothetical protein